MQGDRVLWSTPHLRSPHGLEHARLREPTRRAAAASHLLQPPPRLSRQTARLRRARRHRSLTILVHPPSVKIPLQPQ